MSATQGPGPDDALAQEGLDLKAPGEADSEPREDVDSEPQKKWRPNAELLRALSDAQRDLKPGESSLYWDWTATRESAPEAEDVRPSGEGEVFVHERDAAATYIAKVEVAPAAPPRQSTKSRIRVRDDVDPRRLPTVRTSTPGTWAHEHGQGRSREIGQPLSANERPVFGPMETPSPAPRPDRRKRLYLAVFVGVVSGTLAFLWLRASQKAEAPLLPGLGPTCAVDDKPPPGSAPANTAPPDTAPPSVVAMSDDAASRAVPRGEESLTSVPDVQNTSSAFRGTTSPDPPAVTNGKPSFKRPSGAAPRGDDKAPPQSRDAGGPVRAAGAQGGGGFLIRKKGSN